MPTPPELRKAAGNVGEVEVFGEFEAQHLAEADGHKGIAAEIEVDLQRVGKYRHPGQRCGDGKESFPGADGFDLGPEGAHIVGNEHLAAQAQNKQLDARPGSGAG